MSWQTRWSLLEALVRCLPGSVASLLQAQASIGISFLIKERSGVAARQGGDKGAADFDIAVLIGGLYGARDTRFAISFVLFGDPASAGDHVVNTCHALEANTEFAQRPTAPRQAR